MRSLISIPISSAVLENIIEIESKIEEIKLEKNKVVKSQRFEEAANLRDKEKRLGEELEKAKAKHEGLKNGTIERSHSYSLTYAKKELNDIESKLKLAQRLWS